MKLIQVLALLDNNKKLNHIKKAVYFKIDSFFYVII